MVRLVIVNQGESNANNLTTNQSQPQPRRDRHIQLKQYRLEMHFTIPFQFEKKNSINQDINIVDWFKFKFPSTSNRKAPFIKFNIKKSLYNKFNASISNIEYTTNTFRCDISIPNSVDFACYVIYNSLKHEIKNMNVLQQNIEYSVLPIQSMLHSHRHLLEQMCNLKIYKLFEPGIIPPLVDGITTFAHFSYIEKKNVILYLERPGTARQNTCETFTIEAISPFIMLNYYVSSDDIINISAITDPNTELYVIQRTEKIPQHIIDKERWEQIQKSLQTHKCNDSDKQNICTICIEEQQKDEVFYSHPICNHSFHLECLKEWACQGRSKVLCPNCRAEFKGLHPL